MIHCIRTNSDNTDFIELVKHLDADLAIRDGEDHAFYSQYNKIKAIKHVIVAYKDDIAVACGAIKQFDTTTAEVKRMYVVPAQRGQGLASIILKNLESWAVELNFAKCILETGIKQPEAISLYYKNGYQLIPNYGQYANVEKSLCFEKQFE